MHWPPAAGSESTMCALRPSRPSSNTWNSPTGPAPTITASVSIAGPSISASCDSRDKSVSPCAAPDRRRPLRGAQKSFLLEPAGVEEARQVFRSVVAEHGHDAMAGTEPARDTHGGRDIDATGAAEKQACLV